MHIPAHHQEISEQLGLRSWVGGKHFPRDVYFETIDGAKALLVRHRGDDDGDEDENPRRDCIVLVLVAALDTEGLLLTHVLNNATYSLNTEDREMAWLRACQAAAWVVLQAYELACKKQEWPKNGAHNA